MIFRDRRQPHRAKQNHRARREGRSRTSHGFPEQSEAGGVGLQLTFELDIALVVERNADHAAHHDGNHHELKHPHAHHSRSNRQCSRGCTCEPDQSQRRLLPDVLGVFDVANDGIPKLVVCFLAILELAREGLLRITQQEAFTPIYLQIAA